MTLIEKMLAAYQRNEQRQYQTRQSVMVPVDLLAAMRAALTAMREPTKRMITAGCSKPIADWGGLSPVDIWQAMIDTALAEDKPDARP